MSAGLIGCLTDDPQDIAALTPGSERLMSAGRRVEVEGFVIIDESAERCGDPTPYRWVRGKPSDYYGSEYQDGCVAILAISFEVPAGLSSPERQIETLEKQRGEIAAKCAESMAKISARITKLQESSATETPTDIIRGITS